MSDQEPTKGFAMSQNLMSERKGSRLPELDYRFLQMESLKKVAARQSPMGKYENLALYLKDRTGKPIDVAEIDRKMRTFFEDMITRIVKSPEDFDRDVTIDGKVLMNFLAGMQDKGGPAIP
jgi:hypothetical protein